MSVSSFPALFPTITSENGCSFLSYYNVNLMSLCKLFKRMVFYLFLLRLGPGNKAIIKNPFNISKVFLKFCLIISVNFSVYFFLKILNSRVRVAYTWANFVCIAILYIE